MHGLPCDTNQLVPNNKPMFHAKTCGLVSHSVFFLSIPVPAAISSNADVLPEVQSRRDI